MTGYVREVVNMVIATKVSGPNPVNLKGVFADRSAGGNTVRFGVYVQFRLRALEPFHASLSIEGEDGEEFELMRQLIIPDKATHQLVWDRVWDGPLLSPGDLALHLRANGVIVATRILSVTES